MVQKLFGSPRTSPLDPHPSTDAALTVTACDGRMIDLRVLSLEQLHELHWEQERGFADQIRRSTKGTEARSALIAQAYETVCQILARIAELADGSELVMGMDQRYTRLVLDRLAELESRRVQGGLFEIGFGTGTLLRAADQAGFRVGGFEVAPQLLEQARQHLPSAQHASLCLGNFLGNEKIEALAGQFSLVYWNDVFEHVPPDEIEDYLRQIHRLLVPGGQLVTITPNWHMRPMDVTADHLPPRSTAVGFHLKEYRLADVCELLERNGFGKIESPWFVGRRKIHVNRWLGGTGLKKLLEPALEWLPHAWTVQICRRFGLTITLAHRLPSPSSPRESVH